MSDQRRWRRGQWLVPVLMGAVAALAVGVASVTLPAMLLVALLGASLMVGLLTMARHYVNARPVLTAETHDVASMAGSEGAVDGAAIQAEGLAPARYLFFAGMLTIAQTTIRPIVSLTLSDWLFFAALCAALVGIVMRRSTVSIRIPTLLMIGAVLYVVSGLTSTFGAVAPLYAVANLARFGYVTLVWFWLAITVLSRGKYVRTAVGLWVISVAVDGLAAILQAKGVAIPFPGPAVVGRMTGFAEHVNGLGGSAAVAMAPALALIFTSTRMRDKVLWMVALLAAVAAAVLSGSIAGMAAGVAGVAVWLVVSSCGLRPILIVLAAVLLAVGIAQVQAGLGLATPVQRLLAVTGQSEGGKYSTVATRVHGYEAAWAALGGGGWVGHGAEPGIDNGNGARSVHNLVVKAWYEYGWAAAIGMLCVLLGGLGYALLAARLAATDTQRLLAVGLVGAVVAFLAFAFNNPLLSQRYGWVSVALALSCLSVARADAERAQAEGLLAESPEGS